MIANSDNRSRAWLLFGLVITLLTLISGLIVWNQYRHHQDLARQTAGDQMAVLEATISDLLADGRYDAIQPLLDEWGIHHPDTLSITLTGRSGFMHGSYQRAEPSRHQLRLEQTIQYGYRGSALLVHSMDTGPIRDQLLRTTGGVLAALVIVVLFGAYLVVINQKREQEAHQLALVGRQLNLRNDQLVVEQALLQSVIDSIPDLICFKSVDGSYDGANRAFCQFHGIDHEQVSGSTDSELFDQQEAAVRSERDRLVIRDRKEQRADRQVRDYSGHSVLLDSHRTPYFDKHGKLLGMISIERDITRLRDYQESLENMAYRDPLTGLPNRRYLVDRMQRDMTSVQRHGRKLGVCALDLDGFKPINDNYGHEMGDRVIVAFAARLQTMLREDDTVARWGGDEFTVLLNDIDHGASTSRLLDRMLELISEPFRVAGVSMQLTASIGITIYPDDDQDADTLLRHADQAMYHSKQAGKNVYTYFDPEQDRRVHQQAEQLTRLIQGISDNELRVYYQPQINMFDGALHGLEALVRWQHPDEGLLPPAAFLPLVENHPAGIQLDWWVVEQVLRQLRHWNDEYSIPSIGVNITAITLQQSDFVDRLQALLGRYPVGAGKLQLEILETSALHDIAQVTDTMQRCARIGVSFALDDFGTGYSSLTYLRRLPATVLKIDKSFVLDMLDDEEDLKIVEGILRLAEAFDLATIAEGVESIPHGSQLLLLGCTYAQGYGIAKPMPAEEIPDWIGHYRLPQEWARKIRLA